MPDFTDMPCWFLGANSPKGYFSKFDRLITPSSGGKCFLIKGGPGTGKSTMLKKIASVLNEKGMSTELVFCAADPDSLDAVATLDGKFSAFDATLPHAAEPKYPGAFETEVFLSDCWDEDKLRKNAKKIAALFDENRRLHEEARHYISAAAGLLEEAARLGLSFIDAEKVEKTALNICKREFGKKTGRKGSEKIRFLSAITAKGVTFFSKTPKKLCKRIYIVEDDPGAVSRIFMSTVRKTALEHGLDIITCRCPVFPAEKTEHIFIPSLGLGFMTSNRRHKIEAVPYRTIHSCRFADTKKSGAQKIKIRFALRLASELIEKSTFCMKEAKSVHDELESFYIDATDFSLVEKKLEKIITAIE